MRRLSADPNGTLTSDPYCYESRGQCLIANIDLSSNGMRGFLADENSSSPFSSGALMWVQELDFSNNSLTGVPLDSLAAMPRLRTLLAAHNSFDYESTPSELLRACAAPFGLQCTGLPQESCSAFGGPYRATRRDCRIPLR